MLRYVIASPSSTAKRSRKDAASFLPFSARAKTPLTESMAAIMQSSSEHCSSPDTRRDFPSIGDTGSSARRKPKGRVRRQSSSNAPRAYRSSKATRTISGGGGASHSNRMRLSTPKAFSCKTMLMRSPRCISGTCCAGTRSQ
eukprot:scaffold2552_cov380-Prasinococcus_capsulatus_cf.AAC.18